MTRQEIRKNARKKLTNGWKESNWDRCKY
jgi:hypothetical protein